jgi:hypothetical protein
MACNKDIFTLLLLLEGARTCVGGCVIVDAFDSPVFPSTQFSKHDTLFLSFQYER